MTTRLRSHPLTGLEPPRAPDGLRARTLAAARGVRPAAARDVWSRLWASRSLRLLWTTAVVGLLLAHLALSLRAHPAASLAKGPLVAATTASDLELEAFLDLEPIGPDPMPHLDDRGRAETIRIHAERSQPDAS